VRKAFSMAIDRPTIIAQLFNGVYTPADGYGTSAAEGYVPNQCGASCTFDPQRARELLAQAGGFRGPLTLTANADGANNEWMQAVATNLRQNLGVDAQYMPVPSAREAGRLASAKQYTGLFRNAWQGDYPNIETFLTQLYRTGASSNYYGYSNPAVDQAFARADAAPTVPAAEAGYAEAERLVLGDMPNIPLWSRPVLWGDGPRLTAGEQSPLNRVVSTSFRLPQG